MQTLKDIFVPYEIAQKLKEIGFDEPCIAFYEFANPERLVTIIKKEETFLKEFEKGTFTSSNYAGIGCPTYEQVFKWFREKGYHIIIDKVSDRYGYFIRQEERIDGEIKTDIYEQAREQAILKTIEIYKKEQ